MKFSLVMATVDRWQEVESCLYSLKEQIYQDFEIIIIDQSNDSRTEEIVDKFNWEKISYHRVDFKGLSKARNEALKYVTGKYICLLDDDAYYEENYLLTIEKVVQKEKNNELEKIYSGHIWDTERKRDFVVYNAKKNEKILSIRQILRTCPSAALAIPMSLFQKVGGFDEKFGVGGSYGAAEETDLLLRGYKQGYRVIYLKNMSLKHPVPIRNESKEKIYEKLEKYSIGRGALYRKHLKSLELKWIIICFAEEYGKIILKNIIPGYDKDMVRKQLHGFRYGLHKFDCEK